MLKKRQDECRDGRLDRKLILILTMAANGSSERIRNLLPALHIYSLFSRR